MIGRLRSLFGKSGKEPDAGTPAPPSPAATAPAPSQDETAEETERRLTAAVVDSERRGGDGVALGDALMFLADFRMRQDRPAEAEPPLRRVLQIEAAAAPVRPDRLVMAPWRTWPPHAAISAKGPRPSRSIGGPTGCAMEARR
jgi:hypothetical protein